MKNTLLLILISLSLLGLDSKAQTTDKVSAVTKAQVD